MQKKHTGGLTVTNLTRKHQTNQYPQSLSRTARFSLTSVLYTLVKKARFVVALLTIVSLSLLVSCAPGFESLGLVGLAHAKTATIAAPARYSSNNHAPTQKQRTTPYENPRSKGISLSILQATPVVSDTSGYHITINLQATNTALPEGTVQVAINAGYTFVSRTDMQNWAQGQSRIPTLQILGSAKTSSLAAGTSTKVQFDIPADNPALKSIWHWGPKPLSITYYSQNYSRYKSISSFLTRSNVGLHATDAPTMKLTAVMPMLTQTQYSIKSDIPQHIYNIDSLLQTSKNNTHHILQQADLANKHAKLQTIADSNTLQAARLLFLPSAYMQRAGFDISAYADEHNREAYSSAGIAQSVWSAKNSQALVKNTNNETAPQSYAWQTGGRWTLEALEQAKRNGYDTVLSTDEFDSSASQFALRNGIYDIETPAGNVRVLASQAVLSTLANGNPTDNEAVGEHTRAGRINRLVAQSAFYHMEQPYLPRHILVTFSQQTSVSDIDATMSALEQSPWLSLSDLKSMAQTQQETLPYWKRNNIMRSIPHSSAISATTAQTRRKTLNDLSHHRNNTLRFVNHILDYRAATRAIATEGDAQALAKQTAQTRSVLNVKIWKKYVLHLYDSIALHDLVNRSIQKSTKSTSTRFTRALLSGIRIIAPHDITAVSETASMPVTISNNYRYPVQVYLSADTHAMEIVTNRKTLVNIPANSETQVTLPLRITTSTHTKVTFVLEDRQHHAFSQPQGTLITSTLQINDKSGTIIIIFAFMLGLLGLWRQFHRKKDPDE